MSQDERINLANKIVNSWPPDQQLQLGPPPKQIVTSPRNTALTQSQLVALRNELEVLRDQLEDKGRLMHEQRLNCNHMWDENSSAVNYFGTCQICLQSKVKPGSTQCGNSRGDS